MKIGFDRNSHTFYEAFSSLHGARPLAPNVTFTQATFISDSKKGLHEVLDCIGPNEYKLLFREDSFDPVTKIRRGRFYRRDIKESNPSQILVLPLPGLESEANRASGVLAVKKELTIFTGERIRNDFPKPSTWPLIVLGWKSSPTFWRILQIENISTGEELVYLRSRGSIGVLPELDLEKDQISQEDQTEINSKYESLTNDLYISTAQSIVDHCRDVAEVLLRSKIRQKEISYKGGELDSLITRFSEHYPNEFRLISHYSQIIRQFHQRRKTALQDRMNIRPINEDDAELTVYCISSMIRDLGLERIGS